MTQQKIILCQSVRVMLRPVAVSQAGKCGECDIQIWLVPSSVRLMAEMPDLKTLCEVCALAFIKNAEEPPVFAIASGAMQEAMAEVMGVHNN